MASEHVIIVLNVFLINIIHQALKRTPLHFTFWVFSRSWLGRFHWQPSSPVVRRCCVWWHSAMWWEEEQHVDVETLTLSPWVVTQLKVSVNVSGTHYWVEQSLSVLLIGWSLETVVVYTLSYLACTNLVLSLWFVTLFFILTWSTPPVAGDGQCHAGVP